MTNEEKKERNRIACKKYYEKNKEKKAEKWKEYYEKNKEKLNEKSKQYNSDNTEHLKEIKRQWYYDHREESLEKSRQYKTEHIEERRAYQKEYFKTKYGKAVQRVQGYKREDKKYNRGECTLTPQWVMDNIFSGQKCVYCGEDDWTKLGCDRIDNNLPHTPENVVCSCKRCNEKRGTTPFEEYIKKKEA